MIKSMTGFGRGEFKEEGKEFIVEIKTVNHKYTDSFIKLPRQIGFLEDRVRNLLSKVISRGKIDVYISYNNYSGDAKHVLFDEALAKTYISAAESLRDKFGLKDDISVSLISRYPDVLRVEQAEEDEEKLWAMLKTATDNALQSLVAMREKEGDGLKKDLLERTKLLADSLKLIKLRAPNVVKEYKIKLETRIKDLLDKQTIDESRIAMEVALFSDRCSIEEEIVRLGSHLEQMKSTVEINQPVGRKLDFLIQEMNREINTIGSKANDIEITRNVIEMKSEIEKMREQIQNIE